VDEVYLEFAADTAGTAPDRLSAAVLQNELPNVIVLRSLSKALGLAGARIGYLVVPEPLADRFAGSRLPLSISAPSEAIALAALADPAATAAVRAEVIAERDRLAATLTELGVEVLASVANFVTFRPGDATALADALEGRGLILRRYPDGPIAGWLRATARPRAENERLIAALRELLS
jgi:histidinol-phosphate aminotransferase